MRTRTTPSTATAIPALGARVLAMIAIGCGGSPPPPAPAPAVTVARPIVGPVTTHLDFTGNTAASQSVTLVARVEGYLEKIHFTDGADVKSGALLFTIQQDQYQSQLQQAEAQVAAQKAAYTHAVEELARYTDLVKKDSAPQTQVDRWQYEKDSAAAGIVAAEAQVDLARLDLSYTEVRAPFDGRMGRHLVDAGNLVGALGQQTSLAEIDDIDPLYVYFTVDERDLLRIREQRGAKLGTGVQEGRLPAAFGLLDEDGHPHQGHLDFASLSVAPTTGTLQVRGIFPNQGVPVLPGLFVRVRIPTGEEQGAILVPGAAVAFDQQGEYVLVVNGADVVEQRRIETTSQIGDSFVVKSGLTASDWVIVDGLARAIPGRKVTPDRSPAPAPPPAAPAATPRP